MPRVGVFLCCGWVNCLCEVLGWPRCGAVGGSPSAPAVRASLWPPVGLSWLWVRGCLGVGPRPGWPACCGRSVAAGGSGGPEVPGRAAGPPVGQGAGAGAAARDRPRVVVGLF